VRTTRVPAKAVGAQVHVRIDPKDRRHGGVDVGIGVRTLEEYLEYPDGDEGALTFAADSQACAETFGMGFEECGGCADCDVCGLLAPRGMAEMPAADARVDESLLVTARLDARGGEDSAIVAATGRRALLVDRAGAVDEHGAPTVRIETHDDGTFGPSGCGEEERRRNPSQCLPLVGPDVNEVCGAATRGAVAAWHVDAAPFALRVQRGIEPGGEGARVHRPFRVEVLGVEQVRVVAHHLW